MSDAVVSTLLLESPDTLAVKEFCSSTHLTIGLLKNEKHKLGGRVIIIICEARGTLDLEDRMVEFTAVEQTKE